VDGNIGLEWGFDDLGGGSRKVLTPEGKGENDFGDFQGDLSSASAQ